MTVDVEDYFQVQAFEQVIPRVSWDEIPRRVEANVNCLLELFAAYGTTATFFTLGWIAERHPEMVRRIAASGHELASHGYEHTRVNHLSPVQFRNDIRQTKDIIEGISGRPVLGYRAPTFSLTLQHNWAYEILEEEGYAYSSSIYPIRHDLYGSVEAPRQPFRPHAGCIWEFPLSTRRLLGQNIPCSGGGYFRLLPYSISRRNLRYVNETERAPCIFYMHPWEIDVSQPRIAGVDFRARLRHYINMKTMLARVERLIGEFKWSRMEDVFADYLNPEPTTGA